MPDYRPQTRFQTLLAWLEHMPNAVGRSCGRKLKRRMTPRSVAAFEATLARIGPDDTCLDLGANLGVFTRKLAATGARVEAYEPDAETFARLQENVGHLPNVTLHQKAVGAKSGTVFLRRAIGYAADRDVLSQAATVVFDDPSRFDAAVISVEQVGFRDLLAAVPGRVALIKMDIEGAEFDILSDILDGTMPANFDALFVETHEKDAPEKLRDVRRFRAAAARLEQPCIDLYWP